MKVKTSITLSEELVSAVERIAEEGESRSAVIERLLRERLTERARETKDRRDLALINKHAEQLNEEAEDVLKYQVEF
jgi:metal-responsive CopG/Arc/MetJ family transcriptional regulator